MTGSILVTGGAGFIGSHLVDSLLEEGHRVVTLDNFNDFYDPRLKRNNIKKHLDYNDFVLVEGDIIDDKVVESCIRKHDIQEVIHLAARAGVRPSIKNPRLYHEVNILGTLNMLESCRKYNVRKFIFASSSSVYGNNPKVPFSESDSVDNPVSPYASTKKAGELMVYTYHHLYNIDAVCLRFFTVYGPRQRPEMAIHLFTHRIVNDKAVTIFGDGSSSRDYTYISDIIKGVLACRNLSFGYDIINLGRSDPIKLSDLIGIIERALGKKAKINYQPHQQGDVDRTYADISKAERMLDYKPEVSISEGIELFLNWYAENNELLNS